MITMGIIISFILCTIYYFVETVRNGMGKKRWITAGIVLGPMALPMFQISKKINLRKATGYNSVYLRA